MVGELRRRSLTPTPNNEIESQIEDRVTFVNVNKLDSDIGIKNPGSIINVRVEEIVKASSYEGAITFIQGLMLENLKK